MSMIVALDQNDRIVPIEDVCSGLACGCSCIECGEPVVARKGLLREHHFAHYSNKVSCFIRRESLLHRFGKQVIREALGLQLPTFPGHQPLSEDTSSWWDFESVAEEVWMGDFRPDLVAHLSDGPLLIEVAVTSFIDEEKFQRIKASGCRTIEIDLRPWFIDEDLPVPSDLLRNAILHQVERKHWIYPEAVPDEFVEQPESMAVALSIDCLLVGRGDSVPIQHKFNIEGMWVSAKVLSFGSMAVKSWVYNPQVTAHLKELARKYGGRYVPKYKNWLFQPWATKRLFEELMALDEESVRKQD